MTLTDFLLSRIAEDESVATAAGHGCGYLHEHNAGWVEVALPEEHNTRSRYELRFIIKFNPARALAECEAKRQIVELHAPFHVTTRNDGLNWDYRGCGACEEPDVWEPADGDWWPCLTLRLLALPYADHPDYDEDWRP